MMGTKTALWSYERKTKYSCERIEADRPKRSYNFGHQASLSEVSSMEKSSLPAGSKKRGPLVEVLEGQKEKKLKIDIRSVKLQCWKILKTLMTRKDGWAFSESVDRMKLNIPNYFSIISHPMDLGTIKSKLEKNMYSGAEEFAADIRLTFSNAMLYHPPANSFHKIAKNLKKIFEMRWSDLMDGNSNHGSINVEPAGKSTSEQIKKVTPPLHNMLVTKRSIPCQEKVRRIPVGATDGKAVPSKTAQNCTAKLLTKKANNRGTDSGSRQAAGSSNIAKRPSSLVGRKCGSCGNTACGCRKMKLDPDSEGIVSNFDGQNICLSPQLTTPVKDAAPREGWSLFDVQLSPKRALRAARLKSCFGHTFLKVLPEKILDPGCRSDPLKKQQEKARVEGKIEAEIRAANAEIQKRAEIELKQQREREREEARVALEKMQRTIGIEQDSEILEELERLTGYSLSTPLLNYGIGGSPLEQLGLFLKAEYSGDEDDDSILNDEVEEGEIICNSLVSVP